MSNKHIIFLGAGAAFTSGYPLGNDLRLRMTSAKELHKQINLGTNKKAIGGINGDLVAHLERHKPALSLFRNGGFASVDEFCKLAQGSMEGTVEELKRVMRFALCLHNPEDEFQESDYYPFLQRLFLPDKAELRSDISILSFNYDPYLEYLVGRAFTQRWRANNGEDGQPPLNVQNAIQSGLLVRSED